MRLHMSVAAVAAIALAAAGPAAAAPNRSTQLGTVGTTYTWTSDPQVGAVYTSTVASKLPACSPVYACDATLVQTGELGDLAVQIAGQGLGGQDTLKDVDLHVYASDASGTKGDLLYESTGSTAQEAVTVPDADPGYYLVYVDWYLGAGSVSGTAQLLTPTPPDAS